MDIYKELVSELLPEGLLTHFDIVSLTQEENHKLKIHLEEKNIPPAEYIKKHIRANGFLPETEFKDFPLRTKLVTLCVKRRRWLLVEENKKVMRDLTINTPGTRLTSEFALFFKGLTR